MQLKSVRTSGGRLFSFLFVIWGGLGFLVTAVEVIGTNTMNNVGVGQSAYVTMHLTWYIAGMMFFGLGALLSNWEIHPHSEAVELTTGPADEFVKKWKNQTTSEPDLPPLPGRKGPFEYKGFTYYQNSDGSVDASTSRGWWRLSSLEEYRKYIDRHLTKNKE
jgi:hypothetical protein